MNINPSIVNLGKYPGKKTQNTFSISPSRRGTKTKKMGKTRGDFNKAIAPKVRPAYVWFGEKMYDDDSGAEIKNGLAALSFKNVTTGTMDFSKCNKGAPGSQKRCEWNSAWNSIVTKYGSKIVGFIPSIGDIFTAKSLTGSSINSVFLTPARAQVRYRDGTWNDFYNVYNDMRFIEINGLVSYNQELYGPNSQWFGIGSRTTDINSFNVGENRVRIGLSCSESAKYYADGAKFVTLLPPNLEVTLKSFSLGAYEIIDLPNNFFGIYGSWSPLDTIQKTTNVVYDDKDKEVILRNSQRLIKTNFVHPSFEEVVLQGTVTSSKIHVEKFCGKGVYFKDNYFYLKFTTTAGDVHIVELNIKIN